MKQVHSVQGYILLLLLLLIVRGIPLICDEVVSAYFWQLDKFTQNEIWPPSPVPLGYQITSNLKIWSFIYAYFVVFLLEHKPTSVKET